MLRHGEQMNDLTFAVLHIDYAGAHQVADEIAQEPRLARPRSSDATELNASLPPRFFELQDEMTAAAETLARAARSHDTQALASAYGRLCGACVSCHDVYMHDTPGGN
jgi:cytochrome c556